MSDRHHIRHSIGFKLLRYVFGFYCIVTVILTGIHLTEEYLREKKALFQEFELHERSLISQLTNSVLHLDIEQLNDTLLGIIEFPLITGASVHTVQQEILGHAGEVAAAEARMPIFEFNIPEMIRDDQITYTEDLFSHRFELIQKEYSNAEFIGTVTLYSHPDVLYARLLPLFSSIIIAAVIKTLVLWGLFIYFGSKLLSDPLNRLIEQFRKLPLHTDDEVPASSAHEDELDQLDTAFQIMSKHLADTLLTLNLESNRKTQFLANMSHEIRTPLNAVSGMTYLLGQTPLNRQQIGYLDTINNSMSHVTGLIDDLLDVSKIESGKLTLESTVFDIESVFESLTSFISPDSSKAEIELYYTIPFDIPEGLKGDPLRLGQVLINLVSNAIKFSKSGNVVISVEAISLQPDIVLQFDVRDQGIGMTRDQSAQVFELFQQADPSTTRRYGGTGLGLTISKYLVEAMGGDIWVSSVLGEGSCFSFTANFKVQEHLPHKSTEIPDGLKNARILVADDSDEALRILSNDLKRTGIDFTLVRTAPEALNELLKAGYSASENSYDLAIMDSQLPGLEQVEKALTINADANFEELAFLLIGNVLSRESIQEGILTDVANYLFKPFTYPQILKAIEEAITQEFESIEAESSVKKTKEPYKGHILLVEDQDTNRQIANEILRIHHFSVEMVENGREAVDRVMLDPGRFDLVLMDLQMPVMDGYAASRRIREFVPEKMLPIIAMTAHALPDELARCQAAGMNAHITKPIHVDVLLAELEEWLSLAALDREREEQLDSFQNSVAYPIQLPGVNLEDALGRLGGNQELYFKLLKQFVERYESVILEIRSALDIGDTDSAMSLCHQFTGVAANLSVDDVSAASRGLENALREKRMGTNRLLGQLESEFEAIKRVTERLDSETTD